MFKTKLTIFNNSNNKKKGGVNENQTLKHFKILTVITMQ